MNLLYIVLFLHQTTTIVCFGLLFLSCISYYSYIKPQQDNIYSIAGKSCISYYSYIKPQRNYESARVKSVVYRTIPTSNHNSNMLNFSSFLLYIVLFLHQTTTNFGILRINASCISYYSYIKPQRSGYYNKMAYVVYRTIPTSNHN